MTCTATGQEYCCSTTTCIKGSGSQLVSCPGCSCSPAGIPGCSSCMTCSTTGVERCNSRRASIPSSSCKLGSIPSSSCRTTCTATCIKRCSS